MPSTTVRSTTVRSVLVAGSAFLVSTMLAACGSSTAPTGALGAGGTGQGGARTVVNTSACKNATPHVEADTPTIALLGVEGTQLSSYQQDIDLVLTTSRSEGAHVIVNGVSGGNDAPNLLASVVMTAEGDNNLLRTQNLQCKTAVVADAITELKAGKAPARADAFDAVSALAGDLEKDPSKTPTDVVLLTPLAANAGGVDLSRPTTLADPVGAVNKLASQGLIPNCNGYRFYAVSPAAGLSGVQEAQLKAFWLLYAKKCGGELVAWSDHLSTFPVTTAVAPPDTSQIQVQRTPTEVTATLGSDVLFAPDSAELQTSANAVLGQLLDLAKQYDGGLLISGYVNPAYPGINSAGDKALSLQRATAVKTWLVAGDVAASRITVVGKGSADAVHPDPATDAQSAANRRVVIVIDTTGVRSR